MDMSKEEPVSTPQNQDWNLPKPHRCVSDQSDSSGRSIADKYQHSKSVTWTVNDIAKAGFLIAVPTRNTEFEDEQEMRRVYTLIYDVFRYKNIMMHALNDVGFFQIYPELLNSSSHVWLLLYDLYHRNFKSRSTVDKVLVEKFFADANLMDIEQALWTKRIKLAASISRLRIENSALSLSDLLPDHLGDNKRNSVTSENFPVTCWINLQQNKNSKNLHKSVESIFNLNLTDGASELFPEVYKYDEICPYVLVFHSTMRTPLAQSSLVKEFKLIVQDKSFCIGPAVFSRLLSEIGLSGNVIQTHVNSPRTTAYLANLLSQNEKIKSLMAFGAGNRKSEYDAYFASLGMKNIMTFSDRLIDVSPDAPYMEEVVGIFVTPPNSYTAVVDPIDLVCSRGGDLSMLQALTEADDTKEGRERAHSILDEQKKTLKFSMSRPQIQMVLYETHSELDVENKIMIDHSVSEVNKLAKIHHAQLQLQHYRRPQTKGGDCAAKPIEINNNEMKSKSKEQMNLDDPEVSRELNEERMLLNIKVPDTDIFDILELRYLPNDKNEKLGYDVSSEGCYLALLQRKSIIKLDNKYMIQMAENRGLFGQNNEGKEKEKREVVKKKPVRVPSATDKPKRRITDAEILRISQPTMSFLGHTKPVSEVPVCSKCLEASKEECTYKRWWVEAARHLFILKKTIQKSEMSSKTSSKSSNDDSLKSGIHTSTVKNIDEIAAKSRQNNKPLLPRLQLSRIKKPVQKVPLEMSNLMFPAEN